MPPGIPSTVIRPTRGWAGDAIGAEGSNVNAGFGGGAAALKDRPTSSRRSSPDPRVENVVAVTSLKS